MTALLLASLFLQDAKARFAEAKDRLNRHVWEARLDLGDWCREKGLAGAAVRHYEFVRERVPAGHPYAGRAIRKLNGSWKSKPDTADEAIRAEHRRRCEAYAREAAERAFACFRIAKEGGLKDLATRALEQTVEFDVDHAGARGERDEVRVDGFGWVPRAEEKEWREVERSEHFLLYTDRKDARATLDRLERVYKAFYELMGDRFTRPQDRMGVCWLENAEAFERIRARVPGAPAAGSMAFYSTVTHVAYCVADPTSLAHEVTHGLADRGAGAFTSSLLCAGLRGDARRDYWVVEGLACALAEARIEGGRAIFSAGALPAGFDSAPFMRMGVTEFLRDAPRHYSIAQALVVGLILGPRREKFLDFVRDFYDGRGDFARTVGAVALEADPRVAKIVDAFEFPSAEDI
ncbi:MAG: hypothetical protein HYY16_04640, partial [Planctomycetes bacterium]|nr:hypothetical protein [Planctomycetota bacterium]